MATIAQHGSVARNTRISWKEPNAPASPQDERGEEVREAEAEQIGSDEASRNEPGAPLETAPAEQLARVVVHRGDQVA